MINLYAAKGTTNMGDFLNCLPVLSGIYNSYGKINLIIQNEMQKFNGFKDLLSYQEMFNWVKFEREIESRIDCYPFNSWINDFSFDGINPIETTRYEKILKTQYQLSFDIDSKFQLQIPHLNLEGYDVVAGDRCTNTTSDKSRNCNVLKDSGKFDNVYYLNFSDSCIFNANIIKQSKTFVTTFTGISILADLMNVPFDLYYTADFDGWANQSIDFSYKKHFYFDRRSTLKLL